MYRQKMKKWLAKMQAGKKGFIYLQKKEGRWKFDRGNGAMEVDRVYLCICTSEKILLEEIWQKGDSSKTNEDISIMVKDNEKVLITKGFLYNLGFGFEEAGEEKLILLYYRTGMSVSIMWGKSSDCQIYEAYGLNTADETNANKIDVLVDLLSMNYFDVKEGGEIYE